jgi:hypothetical protein
LPGVAQSAYARSCVGRHRVDYAVDVVIFGLHVGCQPRARSSAAFRKKRTVEEEMKAR